MLTNFYFLSQTVRNLGAPPLQGRHSVFQRGKISGDLYLVIYTKTISIFIQQNFPKTLLSLFSHLHINSYLSIETYTQVKVITPKSRLWRVFLCHI